MNRRLRKGNRCRLKKMSMRAATPFLIQGFLGWLRFIVFAGKLHRQGMSVWNLWRLIKRRSEEEGFSREFIGAPPPGKNGWDSLWRQCR